MVAMVCSLSGSAVELLWRMAPSSSPWNSCSIHLPVVKIGQHIPLRWLQGKPVDLTWLQPSPGGNNKGDVKTKFVGLAPSLTIRAMAS